MKNWNSRSLGTKWQHAVFYRLIALGGRRTAYFLLFWVVLAYMLKPSAARRCAPYLTRRFPGASPLAMCLHRWRLQWQLGLSLIDRAAGGITGEFVISMDDYDVSSLHSAYEEGNGVIMLASHIGCWHSSLSYLQGLIAAPASVVILRDTGDHDRYFFDHKGEAPPFTIIDPTEGPQSAVAMIQRLQSGGILGMMGDRPMGDTLLCPVSFLKGTAQLPFTAYYLASVSGAPVYVFFVYRTGPGKAVNKLCRVIRVPRNLGKKADAYAPYAQAYAEALEQSVTEAPYQFFNFYDMWKNHEHPREIEKRADQ
jgi:predicted LPLAT superfamily acyltransferase